MRVPDLDKVLSAMLKTYTGISDLNFSVGHPLQVEDFGELKPVYVDPPIDALTPHQTEQVALTVMQGNRRLIYDYLTGGSCDCSYSLDGEARFRVNIFRQQGHFSVVLRKLQSEVPTIHSLGLPEIFYDIAKKKTVLVLVTGATGSGKTTTLAAILNEINETQPVHVVTLEDPIEYVHPKSKATFNQRELGHDFNNYPTGLRAALRQAPKVILVGEMRDRATVEIALHAAETGHLVLSTLHTIDAGQTINRIVGMFEQAEEQLVRGRLAAMLRWIVGQRLLPKIGGGRLAALEIMRTNLRVQDSILHGESEGKTFYEIIDAGVASGMEKFDKSIIKGYRDGLITEQTALAYASQRSIVRRGIDEFNYAIGAAKDELGVKLAIDQEYEQRIHEERQKVGSR